MTNFTDNLGDIGSDPRPEFDRARSATEALLRASADGELSAGQRARADEHLAAFPADRELVDFDRKLRAACSRAMAPAAMPAGLADRVKAAVAQAAAEDRRRLATETLLRASVDGELTADLRARADQHLAAFPQDAGLVEFDRTLKSSVAKVMAEPMPAGLPGRVGDAVAHATAEDHDALADRLAARSATTREAGFWSGGALSGRTKQWMTSMAAALVLGITVGFMLLAGGGTHGFTPLNNLSAEQVAYRDNLVQFVTQEHRAMATMDAMPEYFTGVTEHTVHGMLETMLEGSVTTPVCSEVGLRFVGAAGSSLPGAGRSAHVLYEQDNTAAERISMFIMPDTGELPLEVGTNYVVNSSVCETGGCQVFTWTSNGMVYMIVADENEAPVCRQLVRSLGS